MGDPEVAGTLQSVEAGVSGYALDGDARAALDASLSSFARARLESHVHEAANTALPRMKARPCPSRAPSMYGFALQLQCSRPAITGSQRSQPQLQSWVATLANARLSCS